MSLTVILSFVVTTIISALMIPLVIKAGNQLGIVAHMNKRTVHKHEIARIGGYAIYLSSLIGSALFLKADHQINAIMVAGFIIFMVGLYDDSHDLSPKVKLIFEVIAALIVIVYGEIYIKGFGYFPSDAMTFLSGIVTLFWIVGITNAINLIDGLDGLASGVSAIGLITIAFIAILQANVFIIMICSVLIGSLLGFLCFNFHPAKIFLGDSGALLIGFIIGFLSLLGFKNITFISLFFPIVILAVPFIDTLFAMIRRMRNGQHIMQADKSHLHHKLLALGYSHRQTVLLIYSIAILFSLSSIILYLSQPLGVLLMFILIVITIELIVEFTGLIDDSYRPILNLITKKNEQHHGDNGVDQHDKK